MVEAVKMVASILNEIRELLIVISRRLGFYLTDKELHFWVFGLVGILLFLLVDVFFRWLSRWTVSAISFIYVSTVLIVFALGMELQQRITGEGIMDFRDFVSGIWGFLALFALYAGVRGLVWLLQRHRERAAAQQRES